MKKVITLSVLFMCLVFISESIGLPQNDTSIINTMKILREDIPEGYMYGIIPEFAQKLLKANPWDMDQEAIKRLSDKIYPDGDYKSIAAIHVAIITRKETPQGDDIVYYIIQYKDLKSAKNEIKKIKEYADYNKDRAILNIENNIALFLFVDDTSDFPLIKELLRKITERIKKS